MKKKHFIFMKCDIKTISCKKRYRQPYFGKIYFKNDKTHKYYLKYVLPLSSTDEAFPYISHVILPCTKDFESIFKQNTQFSYQKN